MADSNLLVVLTVFVALCALSQLGQFLAMFGLYKKVKQMQDQALPLLSKGEALLSKIEQTLESAKLTIDDSRKQMGEFSGKANGILDLTKVQLDKVDVLVTDASERARRQMDRVELVVNNTVERVQSLVSSTHDGILKPVNEINAVVSGVRGGLGFLFKSRRPNVEHATQDEEMFI